jgi:hypothetical protein
LAAIRISHDRLPANGLPSAGGLGGFLSGRGRDDEERLHPDIRRIEADPERLAQAATDRGSKRARKQAADQATRMVANEEAFLRRFPEASRIGLSLGRV